MKKLLFTVISIATFSGFSIGAAHAYSGESDDNVTYQQQDTTKKKDTSKHKRWGDTTRRWRDTSRHGKDTSMWHRDTSARPRKDTMHKYL